MRPDKTEASIGMAQKAGRVASGEFATEKAVKEGKARLVILAEDASANTKKKFRNMCTYYGVPITEYGEKDTLGHSIGREERACLAVNDEGFAKAILKNLQKNDQKPAE